MQLPRRDRPSRLHEPGHDADRTPQVVCPATALAAYSTPASRSRSQAKIHLAQDGRTQPAQSLPCRPPQPSLPICKGNRMTCTGPVCELRLLCKRLQEYACLRAVGVAPNPRPLISEAESGWGAMPQPAGQSHLSCHSDLARHMTVRRRAGKQKLPRRLTHVAAR
jgi:hypothetical protein